MNCRLVTPLILVISASIILGLAPPASAQGMIIEPSEIQRWVPPPPVGPWPVQPITLESEIVQVNLDDQFAHVKTTQIFRNNTGFDIEGTYVFPLPYGADISDFALWLDGRELTAETLEAREAAQIYHQIVASMRDPGLLEYLGDGLIQAHIYPIPGSGTKQIDIEYDWLLPVEDGLMRLEIPLKLEGYSIDRIDSLGITVEIDSPDALGTVYSPTHEVKLDRRSPTGATVSLEKSAHRPQGDFVLYISRPEGPVGLNMLTHGTGDEEGYFLAMIAPEYDEDKIEVVPKDFVCVLDTSGSMAGDKLNQAKEALNFIFRNLNEDDRFQLITFATDIYPYYEGWTDASRKNLADVGDYIDGIDAGGSTNIDEALHEALSYEPDEGRPMYVIFLTDGLPTVGEINDDRIITNVETANSSVDARIFCFGVGDDVDYQFIDRIAKENGGWTGSVAPDEDLEQPLSDFYAKIKSPVLTDIEVDIRGARIYDMLPVDLPDLFLGSQLILAGRFVGTGRGTVDLTGKVGGERVDYTYPVRFSDERENDFIPRHWATRRVGYLLNQIRLYGENRELVDEIIDLARRYGIITPYTSMLVTEDEVPVPRPGPWPAPGFDTESPSGSGALRGGDSWADDVLGLFGARNRARPMEPGSGEYDRLESQAMGAMEEAPEAIIGQGAGETVRYRGDKTFYLNLDGYWEDSEFASSGLEPSETEYLSEEYYELLTSEPGIADYLTVADRMVLVWDGKAYRINPAEGKVDPDSWRAADLENHPPSSTPSSSAKSGAKWPIYTGVALVIIILGAAAIAISRRRR
jgi:Ca-activated chloride channel family protein